MIKLVVSMAGSFSVPARIERADKAMLAAVGEGLALAIGTASRSRQIAAATTSVPAGTSTVRIEIGKGVPFAMIREFGGWITPKQGRALRFANGEFRGKAHQEGIHYVGAGARQFGGIVGHSFHTAFAVLR